MPRRLRSLSTTTSSSPSTNHSPSRAAPPFSVATSPPKVPSSRPPPLPPEFLQHKGPAIVFQRLPRRSITHPRSRPRHHREARSRHAKRRPHRRARHSRIRDASRFQSTFSKKASAISSASPMPACPAPHTAPASSTFRPKPRSAALSPSCRTAT